MPPDNRYKKVRCADCGEEYICTPSRDFYYRYDDPHTGRCWSCFLKTFGYENVGPEPPGGGIINVKKPAT